MSLDTIYRQYQSSKEITRIKNAGTLRRWLAGAVASVTARRLFLRYRLFRPALPPALDPSGEYVFSLTSFPPRMKYLWMVIDSLMRQSCRPAVIYLCLFKGDFPDGQLPDSLRPYLERGLKILWAEENLMPHLKYYYTFQEESAGARRPVITVDDDLFYPPDTAKRLLGLHGRHPGSVCANIARRIVGNHYAGWPLVTAPDGPSQDLLALGFGGVLYPERFCSTPALFRPDEILATSLKADDLWLRCREEEAGVGVVVGEYFAVPTEIPSSQRISLRAVNVDKSGNDKVWALLHPQAK